MTSINPQNEKILVAFMTALGRFDESLPLGLQQQLHAIAQNLEARIVELPTIAASRPSLYQAYQTALADAQMDQGEQDAMLVSTSGDRSSQRERSRRPNFHRSKPGSSGSTSSAWKERASRLKSLKTVL